MAAAICRTAVAGLGQLAVGTDAGLRLRAPEQAVVGRLHGGIRLGPDVLTLPVQRRAQARTFGIETIGNLAHAAPPAAARIARFTATRARCILCELCPQLRAGPSAAVTASSAPA